MLLRRFSGIPKLSPLKVNSTSSCDNQVSLDIATCPLGSKISPRLGPLAQELSSRTGSTAGEKKKPGLTSGQKEASSACVTLFTFPPHPPTLRSGKPSLVQSSLLFSSGAFFSNSLGLNGKPGQSIELKAILSLCWWDRGSCSHSHY